MASNAAAVGDAGDKYGGLGSNGAQSTPEVDRVVTTLGKPGSGYPGFRANGVYNLQADDYIADHSDVANEAVAHAILCAVAAS